VQVQVYFKNQFSQETLNQKSKDIQRNFLIKCRIKFVKIMAPECGVRAQATIEENIFTCVYIEKIF
jgi:hypothetical protein